jgi:hypothetical protein
MVGSQDAHPGPGRGFARTAQHLAPVFVTVLVLCTASPTPAQEDASSITSDPRRTDDRERVEAGDRSPDRPDRGGEAESLTAAGSEAGELDRPAPLGPLFRTLNPARLHRRFDELLGLDADDQSDKPEAPEVPEPVFLEFVRPLGALKYENELNYLIVAPTGRVPAGQFLEYEYVFSDWRAAKLELEFAQGSLETLEPGYQRTFGVGRRHNWVHGFQIFPEIFMQEKFVGGTATYMFNWKPTEESAFSTSLWAGANRMMIQGPDATRLRLARQLAGRAAGLSGPEAAEAADRPAGVWRPLAVADAWYTLSPSVAVGVENDFFCSRRFGEYLILPHVNWQPTVHIFVQVGVGYYRFGSVDQAVFMAHVNLVNPSHRRPRRESARDGTPGHSAGPGAAPFRGVFGRRFGGR